MANNRLLIIGASGFLGQALCDASCDDWERAPASRSGQKGHLVVDLTRPDLVHEVVAQVRPQWVINSAAMTSVDVCERNPALARAIHVDGTRNLVQACERVGCGLVNLSTNYVFDGEKGPYGEGDEAHPVNAYGQTKLESEVILLNALCPGIVVRTAVLYGFRPSCRSNFVTWAISSLARREAIRVVIDEWANPTFVDELAAFILKLCRTDFRGVVHFGGVDFLTRFEMVERICAVMGLDLSLVSSITSAEFGQLAQRPLRAGLTTTLARALCDIVPASFEYNLRQLKGVFHKIANTYV
ncbi:MAG: SDR family oxidoreductase [Gemmatimonadetes bacterium]|nr:SDR family oxidoreductase [Gemmatimonadota bacterium]